MSIEPAIRRDNVEIKNESIRNSNEKLINRLTLFRQSRETKIGVNCDKINIKLQRKVVFFIFSLCARRGHERLAELSGSASRAFSQPSDNEVCGTLLRAPTLVLLQQKWITKTCSSSFFRVESARKMKSSCVGGKAAGCFQAGQNVREAECERKRERENYEEVEKKWPGVRDERCIQMDRIYSTNDTLYHYYYLLHYCYYFIRRERD